jgi:hypothetical protein
MAKQSRPQKETVGRVMHEYKHGELKSARGRRKVKNPKQAIAIALREAGASKYQSPQEKKRSLRKAKAKERTGRTARAMAETKRGRTWRTKVAPKSRRQHPGRGQASRQPTRADLYKQAQRRKIPGRSRMSKQQLKRALGR